MSKIHYFQRYSSQENTVTNNTLQLIARIYSDSPDKAAVLLSELTGSPIEIGPEIHQQQRSGTSIPDGTILQRSFKIVIESKVDLEPSLSQLKEHAKSFKNEETKVLLLLTKRSLPDLQKREFAAEIQKSNPGVSFASITYEEICRATEGLYQEFDFEMRSLVEDYRDYCIESALFDQAPYLMRIVPCGESIGINLKHGIYFHPTDRGYTRHAFLGVYARKKVRAIWKVDSVFDAILDGDVLRKVLVDGRDTTDYDERIRTMIDDAWNECGYRIATGHRFFCGTPHETDFSKESPYGIQGARLMNLRHVIGEFSTAEEAAEKLRDNTWT